MENKWRHRKNMKNKTISILIFLTLVMTAFVILPMNVSADTSTMQLFDNMARSSDADGAETTAVIGDGSWIATPGVDTNNDGSDKFLFYFYWKDSNVLTEPILGDFTIGEIDYISYYTNKPTDETKPDFYLLIYTATDDVDDQSSWYGYRLNAEPYFSNNLNAPANQWNEWNTNPGTNQLTFFDASKLAPPGAMGFYGQPNLQDIQDGTINWNDYNNNYVDQDIDYGAEQVKALALSTGSGWSDTFNGYIDAIEVALIDGTIVTIDLEACPDTVYVNDDWAESSPGQAVNGHIFGSDAFATIQDGVDAVCEYGAVYVAAGTYDGGITIDRSLTITGAGKYQTTIGTSRSPVITVSADDVTIQNLEITDDPELGEGIRVVSPASSGLTVDNVAFTELGAGTGNDAYGIYIETSFSNLSVVNSDFISADHTTSYRTIGIFTPNSLNHNDFEVIDSTFTTIWTGIYLRSAIDGFVASGNLFESVQASDLTACVAGIYMGDGDDDNFDLENINIYENTFTEYGRGVYIWNYAENSVIDNLNVHDNLFENSIWSAAIRVIAGLGNDEQIAFNEIVVDKNEFTQDSDVGAHVGMIDFRTYCALSACDVTITNNEMTFTGGPYIDPMSGILFLAFEGPFTNTLIENNVLDGGNTGGSGTPPSSGVLLKHKSSDYWPSSTLEMNILKNDITGFNHGVSIYNDSNSAYGGLPLGSLVNIHCNNINDNILYGAINGDGEEINATNNWWGDASGPTHSSNPSGTGDEVSDNVIFDPWETSTPPCQPVQPVGGVFIPVDKTAVVTPYIHMALMILTIIGLLGAVVYYKRK